MTPLVFLLLLCTTTRTTHAILTGDEQYGTQEGGVFWTFHTRGVSIVNPDTCEIEHTFDQDALGNDLPSRWEKGAYMELQTPTSYADDDVPLTETPELLPRTPAFVLMNSGETTGEVIVMSTTTNKKSPVVSRIDVGPMLGNAYAVHNRNQFWTHSNEEGYFYVIDLTSELMDHTGHPIKVKATTAHEGQLLWEIGIDDSTVSLGISNIGYATSKGEPHLFILDMLYHKQVDMYDFSKDVRNQTCIGAESMAYSKLNQHLYVQCARNNGGILEYDVSVPSKPLFIAQHVHIGGVLLETPDQSYVTATDKGANTIHFFRPQKTGEQSTDPYRIIVQGHPEPPAFYNHAETFDYIACMPLTQNTNRYHLTDIPTDVNDNPLDNVDRVACDYWNGCSQAVTQQDVDHGMCLYDDDKLGFQVATEDQLEDVRAQKAPFGQACNACADSANYYPHNNRRECICTYSCGICVPSRDAYPTSIDDPLLQQTGVMCVDVKDALLGVVQAADLIPGAGAIRRVPPPLGQRQVPCAMAEPIRAHKRGANVYHASISTVPNDELILVDMRVQAMKCRVPLPGVPQQVVYVPTSFHYKEATASGWSQAGMIAVIVGAGVFGLAALAVVSSKFLSRSTHTNTGSSNEPSEVELHAASKHHHAGGEGIEEKKYDGNPFSIDGDADDGLEDVVTPPAQIAPAEGSAADASVHSGTLT